MKKIKIEHKGVYGLVEKDDKVLLILKSRGPYKGMYDLPGGRLEEGESLEEALEREFQEEVGCKITINTFLKENFYRCDYKGSRGDILDFNHKGSYFKVNLKENCEIKKYPDGHDSLGSEFIKKDDIKSGKIKITPIIEDIILNTDNFKE